MSASTGPPPAYALNEPGWRGALFGAVISDAWLVRTCVCVRVRVRVCVRVFVCRPGPAQTKDDPGKVTYNLLLKNELLGAGVDDMKVGVGASTRASRAAAQARTVHGLRARSRCWLTGKQPPDVGARLR